MDKSTLSNYGWVVIAVLVISVMIALATPFGSFVAKGTTATVNSLTETISKSMGIDNANLGELTINGIKNNNNDDNSENDDTGSTVTEVITNYSIEEIEANDKLLAIGKTKPEYVVAEFNDDYTEVTIYKNTKNSDGQIKDWTSALQSPYFAEYPIIKAEFMNGIVRIGDFMFVECTGLTDIIFPDSVTTIGYGSFVNCYTLETIVLPKNLIEIGDEAFTNCDMLSNITIPSSLKRIGELAFWGCTMEKVNIPENIEYIGYGAFSYCHYLTEISFDGNNSNAHYIFENGVLFNKDKTVLHTYLYTNSHETYTAPATVVEIGDNAFATCRNLKKVVLPYGVKTIGDAVFQDCDNLVDINIPDTVQSIGRYAFCDCRKLTNITLPGSITNIGEKSFIRLSTNSTINCKSQTVYNLFVADVNYYPEDTTLVLL